MIRDCDHVRLKSSVMVSLAQERIWSAWAKPALWIATSTETVPVRDRIQSAGFAHALQIVCCVTFLSCSSLRASDTTHINPVKFGIVSGVTAGGFVVGHVVLNNLWWKGERSDFHFNFDEDWKYALGSDKFGHAYFPYLATDIYEGAFVWSGMDSTTALWSAAGFTLFYQTYIEVRDGFSKQYGFSFGDFGADVLGAGYPIAQHYIPALRNFTFKISFDPSAEYKAGHYNAIIDDYESAYGWLSINVHNLLPESWQEWYPKWINLAIGHSVKNIYLSPVNGYHEWYLALDWNLEGLPGDGWFWNVVKHYLNYYHLPSPAVRVSPGVVWYGLKF